MALFSRLHTWVSNEVLTANDLNGEFNNILSNMVASSVVGASANLAAMQVVVDPGGIGTESLSGSVSDEVQRLRYMVKYLAGRPQWYDHTGRSLAAGALALQAADFTDGSINGTRLIDNSIPEAKYLAGSVSRRAMAPVGIITSAGSGNFSSSSGTEVAVTNMTLSITTTGRPVRVFLAGDPANLSSGLLNGGVGNSGSGGNSLFTLYRGTTSIAKFALMSLGSGPIGYLVDFIDDGAPAATNTYTLKVTYGSSSGVVFVQQAVLRAYEL